MTAPDLRVWPQSATGQEASPPREIFAHPDPRVIAATLKQSAEASRRRRATPFRSAMSMLTFHINRAGNDLDAAQRAILERAKDELRIAFGRAPRP